MTTKNNPLLKAADYIEDHGWCRGDWYRADGKACLAGAIGVVTGALVPTKPEAREKQLRKYVAEYNSHPMSTAFTESHIRQGLNGKGPLGDVSVYRWSEGARAIERYGRACAVLADQIDSERFAEAVKNHDAMTARVRSEEWFQAQDADAKARDERRWAVERKKLGADLIVTLNDFDEGGKRRTTKAKAIKLLRTAAERY